MERSDYEELHRELEESIQILEKKIEEDQQNLSSLKHRLHEIKEQQKMRSHYISSSEILELIYQHAGKESNMSTIKRWADQGLLGDVVDEREIFWALKTKQGKKRFLYPKQQVFQFLYEKQLLKPNFDVLDRVQIQLTEHSSQNPIAVVVKSHLKEYEFTYVLQLENTFEILSDIPETQLKGI